MCVCVRACFAGAQFFFSRGGAFKISRPRGPWFLNPSMPENDARASSRSFFLFLFCAPDSCCLFEAIFEKLAYCQSSSGHWDRKGHPRRAWEVECVFLFILGGGHHRNFFWAIKYISCSACFVIYMPKRCLIFLYWNNIGIIIIITMMIFQLPIFWCPHRSWCPTHSA